MTREALYERVWSQPVNAVAKALGVSDVALGKACRSAGIPTPPRGYWTRIHHRKPSLPRPPLEARPGQRDWVVIAPARARVRVARLPSPSGKPAQLTDLAQLAAGLDQRGPDRPAIGYDPGVGFAIRRRGFADG